MTIAILSLMTIMFFYTIRFSIALWRERNKVGAATTCVLAIVIAVLPFFTALK